MAVNATAIWRVRPSGSNTNGGGYDPGISGAATDYSQQNSAQASGTAGTAAGTTAFSDVVAAAFTSAMVGNALYITGTGLTTGFYFCTAFTDASHITLDRSPGTGTTGTWHLGGGWADFWTNADTSGDYGSNAATWLVPGNRVRILGSGVPNPSSYTYDYTVTGGAGYFIPPSGDTTNGSIIFEADPASPSYGSGGYPVIKIQGLFCYQTVGIVVSNLWFVLSGTANGTVGCVAANGASLYSGCVCDKFGYDIAFVNGIAWNGSSNSFLNVEIFDSAAARVGSTQAAIYLSNNMQIMFCNIHDCIGGGISNVNSINSFVIANNIIAKCGGTGSSVSCSGDSHGTAIICNNTIDGNAGNGLEIQDQASLRNLRCFNNIISNHTGAGKYGLTVDAGTTAANDRTKQFIDYNPFYNNTANYNAISAGAHDTALGSDPYVGQATENYALA